MGLLMAAFQIGQRVLVHGEVGTVVTGRTLSGSRHAVEAAHFGVWVYLPSRGYASDYATHNVQPAPGEP